MAELLKGTLLPLKLVVVVVEALDRLRRVHNEAKRNLPDQVRKRWHQYQAKQEQVVSEVMNQQLLIQAHYNQDQLVED